ncbi:acyltransferase family protein [Paenibacillus marinisediminis]
MHGNIRGKHVRDRELDIFRGLIMIYIIGVIHVVYWGGLVESHYKSLLLFEMPIVFFISGATYTLSKKKKYYLYLTNRLTRILLPYWIFATIFVFVMISFNYYAMSLGSVDAINADPFNVYLDWVNPFGDHVTNLPYFSWHLWFIPVYLLIILFIPILHKYFLNVNVICKLIPLVILPFIVYITDEIILLEDYYSYIKPVSFYMFWTYLGFYYKNTDWIVYKRVTYFSISFISFLLVYFIVSTTDYRLDMQVNKFPPNIVFFFYCLGTFFLLVLLKKSILKFVSILKIDRLLDVYSQYGFTMYLYQPFSYFVLLVINSEIINIFQFTNSKILTLFIYFLFVIFIGLIYPKLFGSVEHIKLELKKR